MQVQPSFVAGALLALSLGVAPSARAETSAVVNVAVDGASSGTPLEPVWPFFGYRRDQLHDLAGRQTIAGRLATANESPVHVRSHFLFNTGDGTPALKWGFDQRLHRGQRG